MSFKPGDLVIRIHDENFANIKFGDKRIVIKCQLVSSNSFPSIWFFEDLFFTYRSSYFVLISNLEKEVDATIVQKYLLDHVTKYAVDNLMI